MKYKHFAAGVFILLFSLFNIFSETGLFNDVQAQNLNTENWNSSIIYLGTDGRLVYHSDEEGNRIPDFSHAGYRGGGISLPEMPVRITLDPSQSGDDYEQIQQAIDDVGAMEKDENGHRGAVLLNPGSYHISKRLEINHSGVVLRGSGDDINPSENTVIHAVKTIGDVSVQVGTGNIDWNIASGSPLTPIVTDFIPVGSRIFEVDDASSFEVGDDIILFHRATQEWIEAVDYGGRPLSAPNPWNTSESSMNITMKREITGITDNVIAIDVPVYNHLERRLSESLVFKPDFSKLVTESGVEQFRLVLESDGPKADNHGYHGIYFDGVEDSWADNITVLHFRNTGIGTTNSSFVTIQNSRALEPHSPIDGARRYNYNVSARSNNILFTNNEATEGRHCFVSNGTASVSGVTFKHSKSFGAYNTTEGHRRWSQGLLYDNLVFRETNTNRIIGLYNRGDWGTRHGWSSVHSVAWNSDPDGKQIIIQKPPTGQNYSIANQGTVNGNGPWEGKTGYIEGTGKNPQISSLYDTQLEERMNYGIAPDSPAQVTATPTNDNQHIKLTWSHVSLEEAELIIERSVDGEAFVELANIDSGMSSFIDESVDEKEYRYRIIAKDQDRMSAWSNVASFDMGFSTFNLLSPNSGAQVRIAGEPKQNLSLSWDEVKTDFNINYTWYLDKDGGDFTNPLLIRHTEGPLVQISYEDLDQVLIAAEVDSGAVFRGQWAVKTNDGPMEMWSKKPFDISLIHGDITSAGNEDKRNQPYELQLQQNYPNPFNPETTISFS
ncbi:MAG: SusE domain-containing protein, partial [Balneolales bacterium]